MSIFNSVLLTTYSMSANKQNYDKQAGLRHRCCPFFHSKLSRRYVDNNVRPKLNFPKTFLKS